MVHLKFGGIQESTLKNYTARLKRREKLHVHGTSRGTVDTKIPTMRTPENPLLIQEFVLQ